MINFPKALRSFSYAINGLVQFFKAENNARVHGVAAVVVLSAASYYQLSKSDWLWILLAVFLVFIVEVINTAIERLVDLLAPEHDPRVGLIKDLSAAAVLLAAAFSVVVAFFVISPYLWT